MPTAADSNQLCKALKSNSQPYDSDFFKQIGLYTFILPESLKNHRDLVLLR